MNRASARDIAFVFQLFALYPHMNVRRNIGFPLKCEGIGAREIDASGSRRPRASCASPICSIGRCRALPAATGSASRWGGRSCASRNGFLMDEPLGALDTEFREAMCRELRALHDRLGATTVYVTHDQLEAMAMADTIAVMNNGVVEQVGEPTATSMTGRLRCLSQTSSARRP